MTNHSILAIIGITVNFVGYAPYYLGIYRKTVKPHAFSWLIWGILTSIAVAAQIAKDGGAGVWVTVAAAAHCLIISALAFKCGEKQITKSDYAALGAALGVLPLWFLTNDPLLSVIVVSIIDAIGFIPTFRKSWAKPSQERISTYLTFSLSNLIGIIALEDKNLTTVLFPTYLIVMNTALCIFLMTRRLSLTGAQQLT